MPTAVINATAVVVAAISSMVIGAIWYSPPVFGRRWMKLIHKNEKDLRKGATKAYIGMALLSLVTAYVLAHFISYNQAITAWEGVQTGFWVWLGFVFTTMLGSFLFEQRNKKLFMLNAAYQLVNFVVIGAILAAWG